MGKIILITGASSGLGLSLSERFVQRGDTVYGLTLTRKNWSAAQKRIPDSRRFFLFQGDASSEAAVKRFVTSVHRKEGRLDGLVHSAGYGGKVERLEEQSLGEFQKHLSLNLLSTFLLCKHAIPFLKKQKESWFIAVSSMAGKRALPRLGAYSASKFGVVALMQTAAKENPEPGFRCFTVCPGGMHTPMREKLFGKEDAKRQQSPDFVAEQILKVLEGEIEVPSGGDIVIRHGQVVAVNPAPPP